MGALAALQRRVCGADATTWTQWDHGSNHLPVAAMRAACPGMVQFVEPVIYPIRNIP
jgi:hypothetical protein